MDVQATKGRGEPPVSEFGDRLRLQREVLRLINSLTWSEELFGLSDHAIARWADRNRMPPQSELVRRVRVASDRLGLMANKSQMQVSDDYLRAWNEMQDATRDIEDALRSGVKSQ